MKKQIGFNLLELMVTLAIAGIVVSFALPSYNDMVTNNCMTNNTNNLITNLMMARSEAIKNKQNISVVAIGGNWNSGWQVQNAGGTVLREEIPSCSKAAITEASSDTTFVYRPNGFIDAPGTFSICNSDGSVTGERGRQITINTVGRPSTNSSFTCP